MTFRRDAHPDELISASLSDDLSATERATLDAHLAGCERCRATLAAFGEERRLLAGMGHAAPPRDLGARVRTAVEAGAGEVAWWRRPSTLVGAFASAATVAAAVLAVAFLSDLPRPDVGATQEPSAVASAAESAEPDASAEASLDPTPRPSVELTAALAPGELGYLSLDGASMSLSRLMFVNDATGETVEAETPSGPPVSAAISPTGDFVAYITEVGGAGVNQVWILRLTDGASEVLGCSQPHPFTERLTWSDDGRWLAFTLAETDLGGAADCGDVTGDGTATNAWVYDAVGSGETTRVTDSGDAFAGDFSQSMDLEGGYHIFVSHAGETPYTEDVRLPAPLDPATEPQRIDGFLPLIAPNGDRAVFWRGSMTRDAGGAWTFERGGMPYVTGEPSFVRLNFDEAVPLFADLLPVSGEAFATGRLAWGADSDLVAFWNGVWTGTPQGPEGNYPALRDVYVGRLTDGGLSRASRLKLDLAEDERIIAVALDPSGVSATVTIAKASAGVGDPPRAMLVQVAFDDGRPVPVGLASPPWNGPSFYGEEAIVLPR